MRKFGPYLTVLMLLVFLAGCSMTQVREKAVSLSASHVKNMLVAQEIAKNLNDPNAWGTLSGMIDGYFGDDLNEDIPYKSYVAKMQLDAIILGETWPEEFWQNEAYKLGYTLGLHAAFSGGIVEELVKTILDALPTDLLEQVWKVFL